MPGDGEGVLGNLGSPVVVVIVSVGDVGAADVIQLNFETMTLHSGVVDGIEVIDGAVSDAGSLRWMGAKQEESSTQRKAGAWRSQMSDRGEEPVCLSAGIARTNKVSHKPFL